MIPEKAQGKVNEATVVATGPGVTKVSRVMFACFKLMFV